MVCIAVSTSLIVLIIITYGIYIINIPYQGWTSFYNIFLIAIKFGIHKKQMNIYSSPTPVS